MTWANRLQLTIPSSNIDQDLYDFPVLVHLSDNSGLNSFDATDVFYNLGFDQNRYKISITTASGSNETPCYVEIESWETESLEAYLWVKVPHVYSNTDTILYLYYDRNQPDNTSYVGNTGDTVVSGVWDSHFVGVWHMNTDPEQIFTPKILYYATEKSGSGTNAVASQVLDPAVNCRGLTKNNGVLRIDLKASSLANMTGSQLELSSHGAADVNEWHITDAYISTLGITSTFQTFYIPLSIFVSQAGELDVTAINWIRWYVLSSTSVDIAWRNAIILPINWDTIPDSTGNGYNATPHGDMYSNSLVNGKIGKAFNFNGTNNWLSIDEVAPEITQSFTWEIVAYSNNLDTDVSYIYMAANTATGGNTFIYGPDDDSGTNKLIFYDEVGSQISYKYTVNLSNVWSYSALLLNDATDSVSMYYNDRDVSALTSAILSSASITSRVNSKDLISIGQEFDGANATDFFSGKISEVRMSNIARSDTWIRATYKSNWDELLVYSNPDKATQWLSDWAKRIPLTIDCTKVDEDLVDFPVMIKLSDSSGQLNTSISGVFNNLTPSSNPYIDNYTKLLLHMEDSSLSDSSYSNHTVTVTNATRSSTAKKFGSYSAHFDGVDDRLSIASNEDFHLGTLDFTIDFWVYPINGGHGDTYSRLVQFGNNTTTGGLWMTASQTYDPMRILVQGYQSSSYFTLFHPTTTIPDGDFTHVALVRHNGNFYMYYGGNLVGSNTSYTTYEVVQNAVYIGGNESNGESFNGYEDELRISKGIARWTSDFTPPNQAYYESINDAKKFAITTADGITQCYTELENWDAIDRKATLWTKVPYIKKNENSKLYLYYDGTKANNSSYVGEVGTDPARKVWDDYFSAVWHFNEDPTSVVKDSTYPVDDGSSYNMTSTNLSTGALGLSGLSFNGSNEYLLVNSSTQVRLSDNMSIEIVFKANTVIGDQLLLSKSLGEGTQQFGFRLGDGGLDGGISGPTYTVWLNDIGSWTSSTDYYGAMILDSNNNTYHICQNDVVIYQTTPTNSVLSASSTALNIGRDNRVQNYYNGIIYEVRLSSIARPTSWTKATYYSIWDDFISYGSAEAKPVISTEPTHYLHGYIKEQGQPVVRSVCLYDKVTKILMDSATSDASGYYYVTTTSSGEHFIVVFDDDLGKSYNALILDKLTPEVIE
jgi:hypothetical protein